MLRLISGPAANPSWRVLERRSHPAAMLGTQRVVQRGGSIGVAMGVCVGGAAGPSIPAACRHPPPPVGSSWCSEEPFPLNAAGEGFYLFFGCFSFQLPPPPPPFKSVTRTLWLLSLFQLFDILHNRIIYVTRLEVLCMLTGNQHTRNFLPIPRKFALYS